MVHGVAGVEGTRQAGVRPIEDTKSGRGCDFHVPPWGHCRENHNLVKRLDGGLQPFYSQWGPDREGQRGVKAPWAGLLTAVKKPKHTRDTRCGP